MFDMKKALSYLPFVGFAGKIHWEFNGFDVYPLLVILIYVVFIALNIVFYLFTRGCYKLSALTKKNVGKSSECEMEIKETANIV